MEARRIRLQGERGISRQTIARGMPECSGCTCMLVCALFYTLHTRPRVQQAPGIPCSLSFEGQGWANLGLFLSRENACLCFVSGRESAVDFPVDSGTASNQKKP